MRHTVADGFADAAANTTNAGADRKPNQVTDHEIADDGGANQKPNRSNRGPDHFADCSNFVPDRKSDKIPDNGRTNQNPDPITHHGHANQFPDQVAD